MCFVIIYSCETKLVQLEKDAVIFPFGASLEPKGSWKIEKDETSSPEPSQDSCNKSSEELEMAKWILKASEIPEA